MSFGVAITDTAYAEIGRAYAWLAERNEVAADKWRSSLLAAIENLAENPRRYPLAPEDDWYPGELRQLLMGKRRGTYRILFEIVGETVYIVRVRHGAQDLLSPEEPGERPYRP
jgi:plasmid stabilization system protein ParE